MNEKRPLFAWPAKALAAVLILSAAALAWAGLNSEKPPPLTPELLAKGMGVRFWNFSPSEAADPIGDMLFEIHEGGVLTHSRGLGKARIDSSDARRQNPMSGPFTLFMVESPDSYRFSAVFESGLATTWNLERTLFNPHLTIFNPGVVAPGEFFIKGGNDSVVYDFNETREGEIGLKVFVR